ncbi:hypothetical protein ACF1AE_19085 [Streptomyces sp. NPDC014986]|uniref:hypothetical protein n=1 Tax=Streptomyces sp. NPDC014986 TaxID=3364934 RepID=UPI0037004091
MSETRSKLVPATRLHALVVLLLGLVAFTSSAGSLRDGAAILPVTALVLSVIAIVLGGYGLATARRTR